MSNNRVAKRMKRRRQLEVREEAIERGINPGTPEYLVWLALIRERNMSFDEAKAQMVEWDQERVSVDELTREAQGLGLDYVDQPDRGDVGPPKPPHVDRPKPVA